MWAECPLTLPQPGALEVLVDLAAALAGALGCFGGELFVATSGSWYSVQILDGFFTNIPLPLPLPRLLTNSDDHVAEWIRLTEDRLKDDRLPSQSATAVLKDGRRAGPQHLASGINAAARELGVKKDDAHRAIKVASLPEQAKAVARETGLSKKRGALLEAAKETSDEAKVAKMREIAEREERRRQVRAEARKTPLHEPTVDAAPTEPTIPGASFGVAQVGVHIVDDYVKRTRSAVQLLAELDAIGDYSIKALADAIRTALRQRNEPI